MAKQTPQRVGANLPYRKPTLGRDYWVKDDMLPRAREIAERCFTRADWTFGFPRRPESWPGMRAPNALTPEELQGVEAWVREQTKAKRVWQDDARLSHNYVQAVGEGESTAKPHVDSLELCTYAAVIYLQPNFPNAKAGTSFYRLRFPNGALGGNVCPTGFRNLPEALGTPRMPADAFAQDVDVANVFNRMLLYRADLVHSATSYFGRDLRSKRMTALFFWKATH
jgi:hypothetical protein